MYIYIISVLKEVEWMPAVDQVAGTLLTAFRDKFPTVYTIIGGIKVFMETPSDLHLQSSTYKYHNTAKVLNTCSPNGAIRYMSPI